MQTVSLNEHSRLESISKSNPTTLKNLEDHVLNTQDEEPEELVKYLLVQLIDNDGNYSLFIICETFVLHCQKTYFQTCALCKDSKQPAHLGSLIRIFHSNR